MRMREYTHDDRVATVLSRLAASDPDGTELDHAAITPVTVSNVDEVMAAFATLTQSEDALRESSLRYMQLKAMDMRALHFLLESENRKQVVTPGALGTHLGITTASVTKLLDRLELGGHLVRSPHPGDRRALVISITPESRQAAGMSVGRQHARRFAVAAALSDDDRAVVVRFLHDMAAALAVTPTQP